MQALPNLGVLNKLYRYRPDLFTEEDVEILEKINQVNNIPFQRDYEAGEFNLLNTAKSALAGFVRGLTTLPADKWMNAEPTNTAEKIAYSIGSLMGFVGWIPSPTGILSKLGLKSFLKALGMGKNAELIAKTAKLGISFKSPTFLVADKVMDVLNKSGLKAGLEAVNFLNKSQKGLIAKDMIQGGLHLGIASAINAAPFYDLDWETFANERASAFIQGGIFGAGNRLIGNLFTRNGLIDLTENATGLKVEDIIKIGQTDRAKALELLATADKTNKFARALSSAIVFGMPSTITNQPLEIQVYEYLLNAFFGARELSVGQREALTFSQPYLGAQRFKLLTPERLKGFDKLSDEAKIELKIQSDIEFGRFNHDVEMSETYMSVLKGLKDAKNYEEIIERIDKEEALREEEKEILKNAAIAEKSINDQLREGKTDFDEIVEKAKEDIVDAREKVTIHQFIKKILVNQSEQVKDSIIKDVNGLNERYEAISEVYRSYGLSSSWIRPLSEVADAIAVAKQIDRNNVIERLDLEKEVIEFAGEYINKKDLDYDTFGKVIEDKFKVKLDDNSKQSITRAYNLLTQTVPRYPFSYKEGKGVEEASNIDFRGLKRQVTWYPLSEYGRVIGEEVGELNLYEGKYKTTWNIYKRDYNYKEGEIPIYKAVEQELISESDIILDLYKKGYVVLSGNKDKSSILFKKPYKEAVDENTRNAIIEKFELLNKEAYKNGLKEFEEAFKSKNLTKEDIKQIYDTNVADNITFYVKWNFGNDYPILDGLERILNNPKAYLSEVKDLVKRAQVLNDRSPRLDNNIMLKLTGKDKFTFVILPTAKSGKKLWWQDETYSYNAKRGNEIFKVLYEAHQDGGMIIRDDIFDSMLEASGYSKDVTTAKGVHVIHGDEKYGGLIGKLAYHRASPKLSEAMREYGIDGIHLDTTTKQLGERKYIDYDVTEDDKFILKGILKIDEIKPNITEIPLEKVISGMQTGIDQLGLVVAKRLGYLTGGTAAPGFAVERGKNVEFAKEYGLEEISPKLQSKAKNSFEFWLPRTEQNVLNADGTVYFTENPNSAGYKATKRYANLHKKPFILNPTSEQLRQFIIENNIKTLNIAGSRGSKITEEFSKKVEKTLEDALSKKNEIETKSKLYEHLNSKLKALKDQNIKKPYEDIGQAEKVSYNAFMEEIEGIYKADWNTLSIGIAEDMSKLNKKVKLVSQLQSNIDFDRTDVMDALYEYSRKDLQGTEKGNEAWLKYIEGDETALDNIDITEELSLAQKFEILKKNDNSENWKKVVKEILEYEPDEVEMYFNDLSNDRELELWAKSEGQARRLLQVVDITPEVLIIPDIRNYFKRKVSSWLIDNIVTPKVNGWQGTFKVHEPVIAKQLKIKPGEIYLDGGLKKQLVNYKGKTITLEEALNESNKEGKPYELIAVRVPQDSASGARVLTLKGFVGDKGGGIYVHPEEYANMGGADNDIDKAFLYFDLPDVVKDFYKSKRDQWYVNINGEKVFREQKTEKNLVLPIKKLSKYSVLDNIKLNSYVYDAKTRLGQFLNYGNRIKLFINQYRNGNKIEIAGEEYNINPNADLEYLIRELVNYSADAGDGIRMKPTNAIQSYITTKLFGDEVKMNKDKRFLMLADYDKVKAGRDYNTGRLLGIEEIVNMLKNAEKPNHLVYRKLKELADNIEVGNVFENIMPEGIEQLMYRYKDMESAYERALEKIKSGKGKSSLTSIEKEGYELIQYIKKYTGREKIPFNVSIYKDTENYTKEDIEEFKANDLLIVSDILNIVKQGQKLSNVYPTKKEADIVIREIRNKVMEWQNKLSQILSKKEIEKISKVKINDYKPEFIKARNEILKEIKDYINELKPTDPKGLKRNYLEALLYSSVNIQSSRIDEIRRNMKKELKIMKDSFKQESDAELKEQIKEGIEALESRIKDFNKYYYNVIKRNFFSTSDVISPTAVKNRIETFKQVIDNIKNYTILPPTKLLGKINPDNPLLQELVKDKEIALQPNQTKPLLYTDRLTQMWKDSKKLPERDIDEISERVKNFLDKHPQAISMFEDLYANWTYETQGISKTLSTITRSEFDKFMDYMENLVDINPEGLRLEKKHWWMLPRSIANIFKGYDWGYAIKEIPVMNEAGKILNKVVKVPQNRFEKLYQIQRIGRVSHDKDEANEEIKFAVNPIVKVFESLPIEDALFLDRFIIAYRESRNPREGYEYAKEVYKKMLPEFKSKYARKTYQLNLTGKTLSYKGIDLVKHLNDVYTKVLNEIYDTKVLNDVNYNKVISEYMQDGIMDINKFVNDIMQYAYSKGSLPYYGINVLETLKRQEILRNYKFEVSKGIFLSAKDVSYGVLGSKVSEVERDFLLRRKQEAKYKDLFEWAKEKPYTLPDEGYVYTYFPRMDFNKKSLEEGYNKLKEKYKDDPNKLQQILIRFEEFVNDSELPDLGANNDLRDLLEGNLSSEKIEKLIYAGRKSKNLMARDFSAPIAGYNMSYKVINKYIKGLLNHYYDGMTAIIGNRNIDLFINETVSKKNDIGIENAKYWAGFMRNRLRMSIGGNSLFPKEFTEDPNYKLKGNPFYYLTDDYWAKKRHSIIDKWFNVNENTPTAILERRVSKKLATLSNLEAKWSLMSLLSSPKTYLTNLLTANINTLISVGFDNWKKASNINYLKKILVDKNGNNIADSWEKITKWIDINGGMEAFIRAEANLYPEFNTAKGKRLLEEIIGLIKQGKESDYTLSEIIKRSGLGDTLTNKGAWFMKTSEIRARRKAWLAHYLKAREVYDAANHTYDIDDPWLIEQANRGVEATQFLYTVVERPDFASTSLGKIFARFQLFMINSLAWRKQLSELNDMNIESKKFQRMMAADMFVLGLASMLPYTIFQSSLPPPYNYLEQLAAWLFGDKEEREKAFYGALPYPANIIQPVLPPSSRVATVLWGLASGSIDGFASYQVWTLFPFGRLVRDSYRAIDNPHLFAERMFGIPYNTLVRNIASADKMGN